MKRVIPACLGVLALALGLPALAHAGLVGTTYYVSSSTGSDTNDGRSPTTAWASVGKVNAATFGPGDQIRFKRGDTWSGTTPLIISAAEDGTAVDNIVLWFYGDTAASRPTFKVGNGSQCVRIEGDYVKVDNLKATGCTYAGFNLFGQHDLLTHVDSDANAVGVKISRSTSGVANYARVTLSSLQGNTVNTSEGYGILVNADYAEVDHNTITGHSTWNGVDGWSGSAVELYNANWANVHHNWAEDNNLLSEIGRSSTGTADHNTYEYNRVNSDCGTACDEAGGITFRGAGSSYGPNDYTTFRHNTIRLTGSTSHGIVCHASCPASTDVRDNVVVAAARAVYMDSSGWTEGGNVLVGELAPSTFVPAASDSTADPLFVSASTGDLHLTGLSPAIDRALTTPYATDLDGAVVPQDGDCNGSAVADSGAYEYDPPGC